MTRHTDHYPRGIYALIVALALGISSCGVKRHQPNTPSQPSSSRGPFAQTIETLLEQRTSWDALKASARGSITLAKGRTFSSKVNIQAIRNKGVRLSFIPFPLIEVARVWFTPEGLVVVDLINDVYTSVSYDRLGEKLGFTPRYEYFEGLILGQIFPTDDRELGTEDLLKYTTTPDSGVGLSISRHTAVGPCEFRITPSGQVASFLQRDKRRTPRFEARYTGQVNLGTRTQLPETATLSLMPETNNTPALGGLSLEYNKATSVSREELQIQPDIKPKYKQLSLEQVLKVLETL